jgi:spore coat polysaccharide biosynthesis predicted glycosyltransferase SpsG
MGGADAENYTLKIIRALQQSAISGLEIIAVVGASNPHADTLEAAAGQSRIPVRLIHDAKNMPELMAQADIAISGGGSTCWEMAFMGLPNIILVLSDNQVAIARELAAANISKNMSLSSGVDSDTISQELAQLMQSPDIRREMSRRGQKLVDGDGDKRVIRILLKKAG